MKEGRGLIVAVLIFIVAWAAAIATIAAIYFLAR